MASENKLGQTVLVTRVTGRTIVLLDKVNLFTLMVTSTKVTG
jgi:hypothetical protein